MTLRFPWLIIPLLIALGLMNSVALGEAVPSASYWPTEEWRVSSPEAQGMKSEYLVKMMKELRQLPFHSVVIIRNGYIVTEAYFPPYDQQTLHPIYSCTKSITSALVGIAIREGYIQGVNQKILDFFPEMTHEDLDPQMGQLAIRHLLTLMDGLEWSEEINEEWSESADPVRFILKRPMAAEPGRTWCYNNGSAYLLSVTISRATGMTTLEYAKTRLFAPLGITRVEWPMDKHGNIPGHSRISMTPRDMAKFGYLYLMGGVWEGMRIIDEEYVRDSFGQYGQPPGSGYGYLWWTGDWFASASGFKNQYITVSPRCGVVAVFTGWHDDYGLCPTLVAKYALPAIKSKRPLRENAKQLQELQRLCRP